MAQQPSNISAALWERVRRPAPLPKRKPQVLRRLFLVVSEGKRTEPLYFEAFAAELPPGLLQVFGAGDNTLNVVQRAVQLQAERQAKPYLPDYDEVWPVFDLDDFPTQNFNNAVFKAQEKLGYCGYSIEAFELWFLLHFSYVDARLHRKQFSKKLGKHLGQRYDKSSEKLYALLKEKGNQAQALRWAQRLYQKNNGQNPAAENPSTSIFLLVNRLNHYLDDAPTLTD